MNTDNIYTPKNTRFSNTSKTLEELNTRRVLLYIQSVISQYVQSIQPWNLRKLEMQVISFLDLLKQRRGLREFKTYRIDDELIVKLDLGIWHVYLKFSSR